MSDISYTEYLRKDIEDFLGVLELVQRFSNGINMNPDVDFDKLKKCRSLNGLYKCMSEVRANQFVYSYANKHLRGCHHIFGNSYDRTELEVAMWYMNYMKNLDKLWTTHG